MTEDDVLRIEQSIERPLPVVVRRFFLKFPRELQGTADPTGSNPEAEPDGRCAAADEMCDSADGVIALNAPGLASPRPLDWTPRMLIVGMGGCGEVYWVDLDDDVGSVYRFESGQEAESSDRYVAVLELPPVRSPETAVRAAIVADSKQTG